MNYGIGFINCKKLKIGECENLYFDFILIIHLELVTRGSGDENALL